MDNIQNKDTSCEICNSIATNLCLSCFAYFCESCFKLVHSKKDNNEHKKEKINYLFPIATKCVEHPKYPNELFCLKEKSNIYIIFNIIFCNYIIVLCPMLF